MIQVEGEKENVIRVDLELESVRHEQMLFAWQANSRNVCCQTSTRALLFTLHELSDDALTVTCIILKDYEM